MAARMAAGGVGLAACWGAYSMLTGNAKAPARVRACFCLPKFPLTKITPVLTNLRSATCRRRSPDARAEEDQAHPLAPLRWACDTLPVRAQRARRLLSGCAQCKRTGRVGAPALRRVTDSWRVRAGNHPAVSGGDDCNSRKAANLKSHTSSGDTHVGEAEKRRLNHGTVTHH
jgi:hypothetical protein